MVFFSKYTEMNNIIYKLLSVRDMFIPDIHLRQSGFGYSAYGPFTKKQNKNAAIQRNKRLQISTGTNETSPIFSMI